MRVLLIEDDRKVAGFIQQGLREEDFAVDLARDGEEGLACALPGGYDVIVLDLMLPRKSGLQVAAELRSSGRRTPILMLTARDLTEDLRTSLQAGVNDFMTKPFRFDELVQRIRALACDGSGSA